MKNQKKSYKFDKNIELILTILRDTYLYIYVSATFKIASTPIIYQNRREENSVLGLFQFELIGK